MDRMNLGLCIVSLLRQYPEVTVPGIGVFRKSPIAAFIDEHKHAFHPPSSRIDLVKGQTGGVLFTDYLKAQKQIDDNAATKMLDAVVQDLLTAIGGSGRTLLTGLGYLVAEGSSIVFEQLDDRRLGFQPIDERELTPIPVISAPLPAVPHEAGEPSNEVVSGSIAGNVESLEAPAADDEIGTAEGATESTGGRRTVWWVAATLVFALLSVGAVWFYQPAWLGRVQWAAFLDRGRDGAMRSDDAGPVPQFAESVEKFDSADVAAGAGSDNITESQTVGKEDSLVDGLEGLSPVDPESQAAPVEAPTPKVTYEIIVGSFKTMDQAEKYVARMKAKGYELKAIDSRMPGNRKKVSCGSFSTEEEAYRELVHVQKNLQPEAWIAKVFHD